jgi:hypothetical protein
VSGKTREEICAVLRACEEALLDPEVRRDRARVEALLAEDFLEFGKSGNVWSREVIIESMASGSYDPPAMEDFKCAWIGDGAALATYKTVQVDPESGLRAVVLRSSLWIREYGEWRVRFHQGTKVP